MFSYVVSKLIVMFYGMLYPAYCSYKAVKNKDVREYVHWMMYWIVFAFYSFFEVFADTFIGSWFPFYYELKIIFMLWLLSPTTRGGSIVYRRLIHPNLVRHEQDIDAYLADIKIRTSDFILQWGTRLVGSVTEVIWKTALRAGDSNLLKQVRRTYSLNDLDEDDEYRAYSDRDRLFSADQLDLYISERMKREIYLQRGLTGHEEVFSDDEGNPHQMQLDELQKKPSKPQIEKTEKAVPKTRTSKKKAELEQELEHAKDDRNPSFPVILRWLPSPETSSIPFCCTSGFVEKLHSDKIINKFEENDEFFDCNVELEGQDIDKGIGQVSNSHVQIVSKTFLQGFEPPIKNEGLMAASKSCDSSFSSGEQLDLAVCITPNIIRNTPTEKIDDFYTNLALERFKLRKSVSLKSKTNSKASWASSSNFLFRALSSSFKSIPTYKVSHEPISSEKPDKKEE